MEPPDPEALALMFQTREFRWAKSLWIARLKEGKTHVCTTSTELDVIIKAQGGLRVLEEFEQNFERFALETATKVRNDARD